MLLANGKGVTDGERAAADGVLWCHREVCGFIVGVELLEKPAMR